MKLYIDPGTGSMLFTILIGIVSASIYAIRGLIIKLRFSVGINKNEIDENNIPYVIFTDSKRYWNVFEPICEEFEKRNIELTYMTMSKDDPALSKDYKYVKCEFIGEGNKAFAKMNMLKADIVLSTTPGLDVYQWKRSKDVKYYVHIPHAASDITIYRMFGIDYYDAILLSGQYQIDQIRSLEKIRNLKAKDLKIVGITYFDEIKKRLENTKITKSNETTVLLASSWGSSSVLSKYGEELIGKLLKTGYNIIVRPHPQSFTSEIDLINKLQSKYPESERLKWNRDNDNFDVLNKADIMISDFSGVIFDYSLIFDKTVIYADTEFDKGPYDAYWLDEELWTFKNLPEIGQKLNKEDFDNIKDVIDNCINSEKYKQGREKARKETWENIGNSTKSVVDYLIDKNNELRGTK